MNEPPEEPLADPPTDDPHSAEVRRVFGDRGIDPWYYQGPRPGNPPTHHPAYYGRSDDPGDDVRGTGKADQEPQS